MLTPRTAWGLDIGESTVKAVKLRRTKVGAEILAFDFIERSLPSEDTGDKDYHLRNAVSALAERNTFGRTPVVVSIPEPAFSRFIPLPPVDRRRIPEVVRYEARQQIPFPIEEVVWDYQLVREPEELGEDTEVAIFSLRSQFIYALLANLSLCKVQPTAVLPVPLALYNHLTFDRDIAKGTIVIDLGAGSTDILICDPENFRVRNITVSGNGITRGLAERLKISHAEAEALKRECSDKVQAKRLFKLIQPTLNDLVGQVQRTIGFFKSQIHNVRIEQALLLGNTFSLPGVRDFFINQLGCDLIPPDVLDRITLAGNVDGAALKETLPSLAVATGLALQGIGLGRVQVNLMPREVLLRQELGKKRPYAAAAVGCLAVMLVTNLLALTAEKSRLDGEKDTEQGVRSFVKDVKDVGDKYSRANSAVGLAYEKLSTPTGLAKETRGCIEALNAINKILDGMSDEIEIGEVKITPGRAKFTAVQQGKKRGSSTVLPAMKIFISGRMKRDDARFVLRQLKGPLTEAKTVSGGKPRPQFANVHVRPETVMTDTGAMSEAAGTKFTATCDFWVEH